jgi:hypothetical protein
LVEDFYLRVVVHARHTKGKGGRFSLPPLTGFP